MGGKMSRIMILGTCPLPFENEKKLYGPGIRTWQFAKPLIDDGHTVCLVCARIPSAYTKAMPPFLNQFPNLICQNTTIDEKNGVTVLDGFPLNGF